MVKPCRLSIRVRPDGKKDEIVNLQDGTLVVRVKAPPTKGQANERLCFFIASVLSLPKGAVRIVTGHTSRTKVLEIEGCDKAAVLSQLTAILSARQPD